jgi:hypothetical protein
MEGLPLAPVALPLRARDGDINPVAYRMKDSAQGLERLRRHLNTFGMGIYRRGAIKQRVGYKDQGVLIIGAILDLVRGVIQHSPG